MYPHRGHSETQQYEVGPIFNHTSDPQSWNHHVASTDFVPLRKNPGIEASKVQHLWIPSFKSYARAPAYGRMRNGSQVREAICLA
jgi:hypothetical protein